MQQRRDRLVTKIDLTSTDAWMDANGLLRRWRIKTELTCHHGQMEYIVRQEGKLILVKHGAIS